MLKEITVSQKSKSMVPAIIVESKITNMSAVYMDILNILFAEIGKSTDDDDNLSYCISASKYQELRNMSDIRDAYKTLKEKVWGNGENSRGINLIFIEVIEKNEERGKKINIFSEVSYDKGSCSLVLTSSFKKMLVDVKKQDGGKIFMSLKYTLPMQSVYSKKVYMMCKRFMDTGKRYTEQYDWDMFREKIGVPESYRDSQVAKRILDNVKKEINEYSDITIEYNIVYKKTKIRNRSSGIKFYIAKKEQSGKMDMEEEQLPGQTNIYEYLDLLSEEEEISKKTDVEKQIGKIFPEMKLTDIDEVVSLGRKYSWSDEQLISLSVYTSSCKTNNAARYMHSIIVNMNGEKFKNTRKTVKEGSFCNIEQHDYNFAEIEKALTKH